MELLYDKVLPSSLPHPDEIPTPPTTASSQSTVPATDSQLQLSGLSSPDEKDCKPVFLTLYSRQVPYTHVS